MSVLAQHLQLRLGKTHVGSHRFPTTLSDYTIHCRWYQSLAVIDTISMINVVLQ
jgi:hypothetical protein